MALPVAVTLVAATAGAEPLTVERAVQLALKQNTQIVQAEASVLDAKSGVWSAYSGILPSLSAGYSRSGSFIDNQPTSGFRIVGGQLINAIGINDISTYSRSPSVSGSWSVLDLSSLESFSSARSGLKAAELTRSATRQDVAFGTRRQFYEVVKAVKLAQVSDGALQLSRDNQRRVNALFEVGSVSRSDLLKAQVQTAQSELDSLTQHQNVTVQRITLATQLGVKEPELGEVDTVLTAEHADYDENALLAEAVKSRPDVRSAEVSVKAAQAGLSAARFGRLPYLTVSGSMVYKPRVDQTSTIDTLAGTLPIVSSFHSEDDREWRGTVALNWNFFDGLLTDSRIASARARLVRANETRDALVRNLAGEVHLAFLTYREAVSSETVARHGLESATENLKLTQQKYNVGSSTILELVDAQVQLQRAQSDGVTALAGIRQAEAQLNRVRGRAE